VIRENDTLTDLTPYRAGPPLREVVRRYELERLVVLSSNESSEGPFPEVLEAITLAAAGVNRYPDGSAWELRSKLGEDNGLRPEQVVLGNGSCELLFFLTQAYLDRGDSMVFAEPTFTMYRPVAAARGAHVAAVALRDHTHDLEEMVRALDSRTRLVIVCNPNNPTGTYLEAGPLREFLAAVSPEVLVVFDEAYVEYVTAERAPTESWLAEFDNLVILRTFSKIYGLAGLRIGYCLAGAAVAEALDKVRQPFNVNAVAQAAALEALAHPRQVAARQAHVARERVRLYTALDGMGIAYVADSQANFVLLNIEGLSVPGPEVPQALLERGVVTRSGYSFGCPGWLRVTIGSAEEDDLFLHHLSQLVPGGAAP
jgi:histidinol-phosphate aminotransferase